jgi:hypothetical protein
LQTKARESGAFQSKFNDMAIVLGELFLAIWGATLDGSSIKAIAIGGPISGMRCALHDSLVWGSRHYGLTGRCGPIVRESNASVFTRL